MARRAMAKNKGGKEGTHDKSRRGKKGIAQSRKRSFPARRHATRSPHHGYVNPPVYHASTVLYPTAEDFSRASRALPVWPARHSDHRSARTGVQEIEGPPCAGVALAAVRPRGDFGRPPFGGATRRSCARHRQRLWTDAHFLRRVLTRLGVTTTYYDPLIGGGISPH